MTSIKYNVFGNIKVSTIYKDKEKLEALQKQKVIRDDTRINIAIEETLKSIQKKSFETELKELGYKS